MEQLLQRIDQAEKRVKALEEKQSSSDDGSKRVRRALLHHGVYASRLVKVPSDYYDNELAHRAKLLNANESQLCKSIIFENTEYDPSLAHGENDFTYHRFYLVVLQYEAKFDTEALRTLIHNQRPAESRVPKKRIHFLLAPEENSFELSGFGHNAITPYGMRKDIPVVLCSRILKVRPAYIYLGGGEVDIKLGISIDDFVRTLKPIIGTVSEAR